MPTVRPRSAAGARKRVPEPPQDGPNARRPPLRRGGNRVINDHDTPLRRVILFVRLVLLRGAAGLGNRQLGARTVGVTLLLASSDFLDDERVEHGPPPVFTSALRHVRCKSGTTGSPETSEPPSLLGPDRPLFPDTKNFHEGQ